MAKTAKRNSRKGSKKGSKGKKNMKGGNNCQSNEVTFIHNGVAHCGVNTQGCYTEEKAPNGLSITKYETTKPGCTIRSLEEVKANVVNQNVGFSQAGLKKVEPVQKPTIQSSTIQLPTLKQTGIKMTGGAKKGSKGKKSSKKGSKGKKISKKNSKKY